MMNDIYSDTYDDYLMHHGVKGMKWGVRKNKSTSTKAKSKKQKTKKKRKITNVTKKIGPFLLSFGKISMINAARIGQNKHTIDAVDGLFEGDFGKASYNNWAAKKYENAIRYISD